MKLFPEQLEAKLEPYITHPFFVAGLPDEKFGQRLVLIVEGEIDSESMLGHIKKNVTLGKFEVPKAIFQLPQFVRTDTGKIRRTETLELLNS